MMAGGRSYASEGAKVDELEIAWQDRRDDAEHLRQAARYSMAISLGLYSLEILLKVRICKRLDLKYLPRPFEIHDLSDLLILSGLSRSLNARKSRLVKSNWSRIVITAAKLNDLRYQPGTSKNSEDADQFFSQLNDSTNGVISWISNQP